MNEKVEYWLSNKRFLVILIALMIIWAGVLALLFFKADEVTKDPCSICAKRQGTQVVCTTGGLIPVSRTYYPNGSIVDVNPIVRKPFNPAKLNLTIENGFVQQ